QPAKTEIIRVNGEMGANAFQMYPNCQALLLDNTEPIVWLAETDAGGYKTVTPYKIEEIVQSEPITIEALAARLEDLEKRLTNESESNTIENAESDYDSTRVSAKSNTGSTKRKQSTNADD
ncbi:MAG: hypothetical protein Q4B78_05190, partial [Bacillota bacterium]|nr:hypothetical protein [Bacillota bacterium]